MCKATLDDKDLYVQFYEHGCVKGKDKRGQYTSWCCKFIKENASILVASWDKFPKDTVREEWWGRVKVK